MAENSNDFLEGLVKVLYTVQNKGINFLPKEPVSDKQYTVNVNGMEYGWPSFCLKVIENGSSSQSKAFWFTKDSSGKIKMKCIIEVYNSNGARPLMVKNPVIAIKYGLSEENKIIKLFKVTQCPDTIGSDIPQDIYAELVILDGEIDFLMERLADVQNGVILTVKSELWWAEPVEETPSPTSPPAATIHQTLKVDEASFPLYCKKDDSLVFGEILALRKWVTENINPGGGEEIVIHYRESFRPDTYCLLPQIFRIKANGFSNEPKIMIRMIPGDHPDRIETYKVIIDIEIGYYYHPRAKRDLYRTLNKKNKNFNYCEIALEGYNNAKFKWDENFLLQLKEFRGSVDFKEDIEIIPEAGFSISITCPLDYFNIFKDKIMKGFYVGQVVFEVVDKTEDKLEAKNISVELNIRKLTQMKVDVEYFKDDNKKGALFPIGATLSNRFNYPVTIEGCELTILSEKDNKYRDAVHSLGNIALWPLSLSNGEQKQVSLKQDDIKSLSKKDTFLGLSLKKKSYWTNLICEPYGVCLHEDMVQAVMEKVIDAATNNVQEWTLNVHCVTLEEWDNLKASDQELYESIKGVMVEVRTDSEKAQSVLLEKNSTTRQIKMANSISKILKTQQIDGRKFQYRIQTLYLTTKTDWTDWMYSDSMSANHLYVYPQKIKK